MRSADQEAQRLGLAGAWVAAFAGLASLGLSLVLSRSLGNRIVRPILELQQVLLAAQAGDRFRRCTVRRAPAELRDALTGVNQLLDAHSPTTDDQAAEASVRNPAPRPDSGNDPT